MRIWTKMLACMVTGALTISCIPISVLAANAQQAAPPVAAENGPEPQVPSSTQEQAASAGQPSARQQPATPPAANDSVPQAPEPQPLSTAQKPVGTATAETPSVSGVAASQPSGVAIAPAKQRRVRTLVLKVGALVGAGVAVGTVVGLTRATPSKPPGAH